MQRVISSLVAILLSGWGRPALPANDPRDEIAADRTAAGALQLFRDGVALSQEGNFAEALSRFEAARKLSPNWALPYIEIAVAHMMTDNDREAIGRALSEAVRLGAEIPRAHYLYGVYLQESGKRAEALLEFVRALQLRPSLVDARYRLAALYVEEGRQEEGIRQYEYVLQTRPGHAGAIRDLAVLYEQSGQLERAEEQLRKLAEFEPKNARPLFELARFYQRAGLPDKARAALQKAERLEPSPGRRNLRPLPKSKN
ncbi:MAG: tetratricopeptide repeat protein [Myxococcales bacterium]|nr:tetratricopeptide repeat protein [Myxococcales bacterium]